MHTAADQRLHLQRRRTTPATPAAIAQGDNFLSMIVPQIMASQAYKNNGAIVIWYDETEGANATTSATRSPRS